VVQSLERSFYIAVGTPDTLKHQSQLLDTNNQDLRTRSQGGRVHMSIIADACGEKTAMRSMKRWTSDVPLHNFMVLSLCQEKGKSNDLTCSN
jgi:hypothetical protein